MTRLKLAVALIAAGITFSLPAAAKLYKWVDDQGTTHYGETIPPQYADKDRSELNKAGRVIKKNEVLTPEEQRAKEQADAKEREEKEKLLEQKRYDKALINTYSNEKEIELARKRNLQQIEARINSINSQLKMANDNLLAFQKEADALTKAGKKITQDLQADLKESQVRQSKLKQDMDKAQAEKAALDARYDTDKARYRELTGK